MHKRIELKQIVKDLLFKKTLCDENIFIQRFVSFQNDNQFPSICVYYEQEDVTEEIQPYGDFREIDLNFLIVNRSNSQEDNTSEIIANQIEKIIAMYRSRDFQFSYLKTKYDASVDSAVHVNETTILTYRVLYASADIPIKEL